jgi:hypothetical protein
MMLGPVGWSPTVPGGHELEDPLQTEVSLVPAGECSTLVRLEVKQ